MADRPASAFDEMRADGGIRSPYAEMARFVQLGGRDVDLRPMTLVADAFTLGRREIVAPFHEDRDAPR